MGLCSTTPNFNTVSHIWINICIIQISNVHLLKSCLALYIIPIPLEILFFTQAMCSVQSSLVYDQLSHQDILHNLL